MFGEGARGESCIDAVAADGFGHDDRVGEAVGEVFEFDAGVLIEGAVGAVAVVVEGVGAGAVAAHVIDGAEGVFGLAAGGAEGGGVLCGAGVAGAQEDGDNFFKEVDEGGVGDGVAAGAGVDGEAEVDVVEEVALLDIGEDAGLGGEAGGDAGEWECGEGAFVVMESEAELFEVVGAGGAAGGFAGLLDSGKENCD